VQHRGQLREGAALAQQPKVRVRVRGRARARVRLRVRVRVRVRVGPAGERLRQLVLRLQQGTSLLRRPQHRLLEAHGQRHAVHQQVAEGRGGVAHREQPQVSLVRVRVRVRV